MLLALLACVSPDPTETNQPPTGTPPVVTDDPDGDGLSDADEAAHGTDPLVADTDGDTYIDGHEVHAGTDPLDEADRVYEGYWPYNPDKDSIADPGFDGEPIEAGDVFGRVRDGVDIYGQQVDLYDWGGTETYVVIDASATWCEDCRIVAEWIAGGEDHYNFDALYKEARKAIDDGRIRWVTYLTDAGGPEDVEDVRDWHEVFPHPKVAVLTDPDGHVKNAMNYGTTYYGETYEYYPAVLVVDGQMNVVVQGFAWDALEFLMDELELR